MNERLGIASAFALLCFATLAAPVRAAPANRGSVLVSAERCDALDAARVRALFALELGRSTEDLDVEKLTVTCNVDETRLLIESSSKGSIERVLKTPLSKDEPERIVALAAAQLVLAAWVEAPRDRPPPPPSDAPPLHPEVPPSTPRGVDVDVQIEAGVRARSLGAATAGPSLGLSGTAWRGAWGASFGLSVDRLTASRALGEIELVTTELDLAPTWRSSAENPLSLELSVGPGLTLVHLRGMEPAASVRAAALSAMTADAKARAALRYRSGGLSLRGALEGGYVVSGAEGTISGDATIRTRGAWAGLAFGVGAAW